MLQTLSQRETFEALGILSELTFQLSPEALDRVEREHKVPLDFSSDAVIAEIRNRLKLAPNDHSDEARDKILVFISNQISSIVFSRTDENTIRNRLGDRGKLRPDLYEITFPANLTFIHGRGINRSHIQQALNYPDDVEHVLPEDMPFMEDGSFSLYVKYHKNKKMGDIFSLLVLSSRKGYKQSVIDAFRIYPSDIDVGSAKYPIDLLKALVAKYGFDITVGNQIGKFFFLAIIDNASFGQDTFLMGAEVPPGAGPYEAHFAVRDAGSTTEIAMAYSINEDAYLADLRKHGVNDYRL